MTTPDGPPVGPEKPAEEQTDEIDRLADQVGSYDTARRMLGIPNDSDTVGTPKTWAEREADKQGPPRRKLTPAERRRIARRAIGPQIGEDALDTPDQSRSAAESEALRAQVRPIADKLFEERIVRERQRAVEEGINPDAIELAMRERRRKERGE